MAARPARCSCTPSSGTRRRHPAKARPHRRDQKGSGRLGMALRGGAGHLGERRTFHLHCLAACPVARPVAELSRIDETSPVRIVLGDPWRGFLPLPTTVRCPSSREVDSVEQSARCRETQRVRRIGRRQVAGLIHGQSVGSNTPGIMLYERSPTTTSPTLSAGSRPPATPVKTSTRGCAAITRAVVEHRRPDLADAALGEHNFVSVQSAAPRATAQRRPDRPPQDRRPPRAAVPAPGAMPKRWRLVRRSPADDTATLGRLERPVTPAQQCCAS